VLVKNAVIGVNYIDTYHRSGLYPVDLPFSPGIEAAGTVAALGEGVSQFREGDEVVYCLTLGTYAEYSVVDAWKMVVRPPEIKAEDAVTAMCQGLTAHYLVTDCYNVGSGDTVLVHAAAGGVGLLLTQMAKHRGARVIGTVSTREKAELAREKGTDHVILYREQDFKEAVDRITDGLGVSVVYESVGKDTFHKSLDCLAPRGFLVLFGQSSGPVEPIDPQLLNQKGSLFLTRPTLHHYASDAEEFGRRAFNVFEMIASGRLVVRVGSRFPLAEAAEAHRKLEGRLTTGKVLLLP
jgi:NADPH2:quinone reductase